MGNATQGYGIRHGTFYHRCVQKIPSTLGTQRSPPSDSQQMVQVRGPGLNTNSCTKLPRNLGITRLDKNSKAARPATKKSEALKVWSHAEVWKKQVFCPLFSYFIVRESKKCLRLKVENELRLCWVLLKGFRTTVSPAAVE
ncbi:hypothetical protein ACS0TY_029838 [Phlomoides rotata]